MCILNLALIDTTPGVNLDNPFCPPEGFCGSGDEYIVLCRTRYTTNPMYSARMFFAARYAARPLSSVAVRSDIKGPYAKEARYIIKALQFTSTVSVEMAA